MSRKQRKQSAPEADSDQSEDESLVQPPTEVNPYEVLSLEKAATLDQIRSAYRKAALKHHPDKASTDEKEQAHKKFQEIAFAYAILSDEKRRKRYDTTGNTAESLEDDGFDWVDFFREQTQAMVSGDMIDKIKAEYQGSEEERNDVLESYQASKGDMDAIYEEIMCSNVLDDDERFRRIIDDAISTGKVKAYKRYTKESSATKKKRTQQASSEAAEAMELAEELGVKDKLFGKQSTGQPGRQKTNNNNDDDALKALIQSRQKDRAATFLDNLEQKYGGASRKNKRGNDEPPEEMFHNNAKKTRRKV